MSESNKSLLLNANAAISAGDNEGFLSYCTDDLEWSVVGGETLKGKQAVREWMLKEYAQPPEYSLQKLIADESGVVAVGEITSKGEGGKAVSNAYCDVWQVREGKLAKLSVYLVKIA